MKNNNKTNTIGFKTTKDNEEELNKLVKKNNGITTKSEILHLMLSYFLKLDIVFIESEIKFK